MIINKKNVKLFKFTIAGKKIRITNLKTRDVVNRITYNGKAIKKIKKVNSLVSLGSLNPFSGIYIEEKIT